MSGRSLIWYKANGLVRIAMARNFGLLAGQTVVTEYPKCGGTWLCQMLEALIGIPYPRLRIPGPGAKLLHGHYLDPRGIRSGIVVWRDPRDILVSHFFHCVHFKDMTSERNTRRVRALIGLTDADEVRFDEHFPIYYELVSTRAIHPYFTIRDFHKSWFAKPGFFHTSYERLQRDAAGEISAVAAYLGYGDVPIERAKAVVANFDFSRVSGRKKGEEAAAEYLRKGIVGDWANYLEGEVLERVNRDLGDELERFARSSLFGQAVERGG